MKLEMGGSPISGRIMVRSITAPNRPLPATARRTASHRGSAHSAAAVKNR